MMNDKPPKFMLRFFKWFCHPKLHAYVEGDLLELYKERVVQKGTIRANLRFAIDVLLLFRPSIIGTPSLFKTYHNNYAMFKNFMTVAFRNLRRHSIYSVINILGLAIGIACSLLILLWVNSETSFDKFLPKSENIYQVMRNIDYEGKILTSRTVPFPTYEEMKVSHSNIVSSVTTIRSNRLLSVDDFSLMRSGYNASEEFLEIFEFPLSRGLASEVLDEPFSIVISETLAKTLFNDLDPMGQMIKVDDDNIFKVTGVLKDIPANSSFQFDYLIAWMHKGVGPWAWVERDRTNWGNNQVQVFVELADPSKDSEVNESIKDIINERGQSSIPQEFFLYPMEQWRLYSNFKNGTATTGRGDYVKLFTIIAFSILVVACVNFMNLSTARSERRAKEVGIRKSLGSSRAQLIFQFFGESLLISLISFVLAIILTQVALPSYNDLVEKQLSIDYSSLEFWIFSFVIIFATGIFSGCYPSLLLSSFNPVKTLKGNVVVGKSGSSPRKVLVILQFGFAIVLIVGNIVIFQQIDMVENRELGYDQEKLITVQRTGNVTEKFELINEELLNMGAIESMTISSSAVTYINNDNYVNWPGNPDSKISFSLVTTKYNYAKTMGAKMLMGRDFSKEFVSDSTAIIVNKAALDLMQLEEPIGTQLTVFNVKCTLIGVIDNILMASPYEEIEPLFMVMYDWGGPATIRLSAMKDMQVSLAQVKQVFEKHNPAYPFDYSFVDEDFQRKFTTITLTQKLVTVFSFLTILITGLGLFGLASFIAQQRIKEVGIRKVLGASTLNLMTMMSKDFSKLVVIAFTISAPIAWFLLNNYLQQYPLRVNIVWWIFPVTGLTTLGFALSIVATQAFRAAKTNPVNSLRSE